MTTPIARVALAAGLLSLAAGSASAMDVPTADAMYSRLLVRYVTPAGVRYSAWRSNGSDFKELSEVVTAYRAASTKEMSADERKAYYINFYNARVVEMILQANPGRSIRDMSKALKPNEIFSRPVVAIDGRPASLDGLKKRLRTEFKDPRVHFALNSAAKSSPPLRTESYEGARIEGQLDDATRAYLAMPGAVDVAVSGGKTKLTTSKIFESYKEDFAPGGGPLKFLSTYGPADVVAAIQAGGGAVHVSFSTFDWSLNATH